MLPRTIRGCDIYNPNSKAHALLLFQFDSSLRAHFLHGAIGLYATTRLWREAHIRYMLVCRIVYYCTPVLCECRLTTLAMLDHSHCAVSSYSTRHAATHYIHYITLNIYYTNIWHPSTSSGGSSAPDMPWRTQTRSKFKIFISGVTILLSLTVFLNLVAEKIPTTSDAVPLIGMLGLLGASCVWRPVSLAGLLPVDTWRALQLHVYPDLPTPVFVS